MFKDKKIFISGGNGVIGNELVKKLYDQGAKLFVGDMKTRPDSWPKDILYREGDLNNITKGELDSFGAEYYFHLAATFERTEETYDFRYENFQHNIKLSNHLMTMLKDSCTLKRVIFASSYLIYDPMLYLSDTPYSSAYRIKESDPVQPRNLTGVAKLNHEIELEFLNEFRSEQFTSISARIFRSYGKGSRDIISRWIRALLNNEEITIYKKEGMFDYIFAGEVAEGLLQMAKSENIGVYNLGNDNARSVEDVIKVLKTYFPNMKYTEKEIDVPYEGSQANMDLTVKVFGWKPSLQIEDAIPVIIDYEKNDNFKSR